MNTISVHRILTTRKQLMRKLSVAAIAAACLCAAQQAGAQVPAADSATAQALFEEGKKLLAAGNSKAACPKFEESQRLDPGVGTQFNLADCYEQDGRTASAWSLFLEVAAATKKAGQSDREAVARARAEALRPKLSRLVIQVPPKSNVEGLEVQRDGVVVGKAQWGLAVPADPGVHVIRVAAPAKKAWETRIEIEAGPSVQTLSVPVLTDAPASETVGDDSTANADATLDAGTPTQRYLAYGAFGVAAVGVAVGSIFGLQAISKNDDSNANGLCDGNRCVAEGAALRDDARSAGNISTIGFAVGGAGLVAGVLLLVLEPKPSAPQGDSVAWSAFVTPSGGALGFGGAF
ncbi:MAG: hypothetical protein AB7S68_11755 [Polyangiaceae bacterium]